MTAKKKVGKKRKGRKPPTNVTLIRNIVLVAAAIVVLLAFAYVMTQPVDPPPDTAPTADNELATPEPPPRNDRTNEEIVAEAQRLFNTGSTLLRQYAIHDENLWRTVDLMGRAKGQLSLVPPESWPAFAAEIDSKMGEAEGLLDQQFRRIKLVYIQEKAAGNLDRALEELDRLQRIFPDKTNERFLFARKQKQILDRQMRGKKGGSVFGN